MGYKIAHDIADSSLPLREKLSWHLQGNHYPPVDEMFIPVAERAIRYASEGRNEEFIDMPNGLTRRVDFIVENLHLEPFIEGGDNE